MSLYQKVKSFVLEFVKNRENKEEFEESMIEDQPLPSEQITFSFCSIDHLTDNDFISIVSDELKVPKDVIRNDITKMVDNMRKDVVCCIEYPYIDIYYRDTYYSLYSRKHAFSKPLLF